MNYALLQDGDTCTATLRMPKPGEIFWPPPRCDYVTIGPPDPLTRGYIHGKLPPPLWMPDICPSLRGSGLGAADVSAAIHKVHEARRHLGPEYQDEEIRRHMILSVLESHLHGERPEDG